MLSNHISRSVAGRRRARLWLGILLLAFAHSEAEAQESSIDVAARVHASRRALEALATAAERAASSAAAGSQEQARNRAEAEALRARLRDGDFRPEDRLVLSVRGDSTLTDTFTVRGERMLQLPNMPPIALQGVLRSELQEYLTLQISRYVKTADIEAHPLIRLAVVGEVNRPGYYVLTPNRRVSDAIMLAGGPTAEADLSKTTARRDTSVLWEEEALRAAVSDGRTLGQLDLGSGDEIVVGERRRRSWESILRTASVVSGIVLSIYGATRIF